MFQLENVTYKNILRIESLFFPEQKIVTIVGESGSGKSTLLKLLNKLISCDQGQILYNNQDLKGLPSVELRRKVVMLPQLPVIFPGTIRENLLIGLVFSEKEPVVDHRLFESLSMVNLKKELDTNVENLSGGEKQRLALARVLLMKPDVLLLDEPSSALDENTEHTIIKNVVDYVKTNNKSLIMVTHSKQTADEFSDMIVEISDGKVIDRKEVACG